MKDLIKGRAVRRVEAFANGVLFAPDGRPVEAVSVYTDGVPPADGRPLYALSELMDEGQPRYAVSYYPNGTLFTPDGRPVRAVALFDATGTAAATDFGTHKAWRIMSDANGFGNGASRTSMAQLEFLTSADAVISVAGGTAFEGGTGATNAAVSNAFDGDATTGNPWSRVTTNGGIGCFIGMLFAAPVTVAKIRMTSPLAAWGNCWGESIVSGRLQYSDDTTDGTNGTWTTAFSFWEPSWLDATQSVRTHPQAAAPGAYKGFAWYPTASNDANAHMAMDEIELFTGGGSVDVIGSNQHWFAAQFVNTPMYLFDDSTANWCDTGGTNRYVGVGLPAPITITGYSMGKYQWLTEAWRDWTLKGSNDGVTWTLLNTQVNQTWGAASKKSYAV